MEEQTSSAGAQTLVGDKKSFQVAGFWRRGFAFAIDTFIVSLPFGLFGFLFTDIAVQLGPWGHVTTFVALIIYFAIFDSRIGKGQSLGKRLMKLRVIHADGAELSVKEAFIRACLVVPILMFNGWTIPLPGSIPPLISSSIFFGGGLAFVYAYIFNRETRQCIHDLLTHSYVVKGVYEGSVLKQTSTFHQRITYGLLMAGIVATIVLSYFVNPESIFNSPGLSQMVSLRESLLMQPGVTDAGVQFKNYVEIVGTGTGAYSELILTLKVNQSCNKNEDFCKELLKRSAEKAISEYKNIEEYDFLRVELLYGFDLGLASGTYTYGDSRTIDEWKSGEASE